MKKLVIAGGSGFLGEALRLYFSEKGTEVKILSRKPKQPWEEYWNGKTIGAWIECLEGAGALINLSGKSVDCRYTEANKAAIVKSRTESTAILQEAMDKAQNPPPVWLNASTATIYVHAETRLMTESEGTIGDDFSMNVAKSWEAAFFKKDTPGIRKAALRVSIALGKEGGAFPKMKAIARLGLGGQQGNGRQFISWIHVNDFCRAVEFILPNEKMDGPINITAPFPMPNKEFMRELRQSVKMPFGLPQNTALLELGAWLMGTETELLLKSRNVYPQKLLEAGFVFNFSRAEDALRDLA